MTQQILIDISEAQLKAILSRCTLEKKRPQQIVVDAIDRYFMIKRKEDEL